MNIGTIVTPNIKGQIVIPKKIRDGLNITKNTSLNLTVEAGTILLHPVDEVVTKLPGEINRIKIWETTAGAWAGDDWPQTAERRREIELEASKKRKMVW